MNTIRFKDSSYKNLRLVLDHVTAYSVKESQIFVFQKDSDEKIIVKFPDAELAQAAIEKLDSLFMATEI